jgi:hypothetical protein
MMRPVEIDVDEGLGQFRRDLDPEPEATSAVFVVVEVDCATSDPTESRERLNDVVALLVEYYLPAGALHALLP